MLKYKQKILWENLRIMVVYHTRCTWAHRKIEDGSFYKILFIKIDL